MTLISIFLTTMIISLLCNKQLSKVILPVSCLYILLGYLLGMIAKLRYWNYSNGFIVVIDVIVLCILLKKYNLKFGDKLKNTFSLGFLLFGIYYAVVALVSSKIGGVADWDDLSHWATIVKQTYYCNAIPTGSISASIYSDYPPATNIWFNVFLKNFSTYNESILFGLWNFLIGMCFLPFWEKIRRENNFFDKIIKVLVCMTLPFALAFTSFLNLKVDWLVATLAIYILCRALESDKIDSFLIITTSIIMSVLVLTKSVAIVLTVVCMIVILICLIKSHSRIKELCLFAFGSMTVTGFFYSWKLFCKVCGNSSYTNDRFSEMTLSDYLSSFKLLLEYVPRWISVSLVFFVVVYFIIHFNISDRVQKILSGLSIANAVGIILYCEKLISKWPYVGLTDTASNEYIASHYWHALCTWGINSHYETSTYFGLSSIECIAIIFVVIIIAKGKLDSCKYTRYLISMDCLLITLVLYIVAHLTMYRVMFWGGEVEILTAFNRYLSMIMEPMIGVNAFAILYVIENQTAEKRLSKHIELAGLLACIVLMVNIPYTLIMLGITENGENNQIHDLRQEALINEEQISVVINLSEIDTYALISGDNFYWDSNEMRYHLLPARIGEYQNVSDYSEDDLTQYISNLSEPYVFVVADELKNNFDSNSDSVGNYDKIAVTDNNIVIYKKK